MEAHFVYYNEKYENFDTAFTHYDGLAVIAVFLSVTDNKDNSEFEHLSKKILEVEVSDANTELSSGEILFMLQNTKIEIMSFILFHNI